MSEHESELQDVEEIVQEQQASALKTNGSNIKPDREEEKDFEEALRLQQSERRRITRN